MKAYVAIASQDYMYATACYVVLGGVFLSREKAEQHVRSISCSSPEDIDIIEQEVL